MWTDSPQSPTLAPAMQIKLINYLFIVMLLNAINFVQATEQQLPVCKSSPNCVSSQAKDESHFVAPFKLRAKPELAWDKLRQTIIASERMLITDESANKLHAEATSAVFRFVDDLYALLDIEANVIHIYSTSRVGYGDFGINRKRVEAIRQKLQQEGIVE